MPANETVSLVYDLEGEPKYFTVRANDDVLLRYDFEGDWSQVWVTTDKGFNMFDLNGGWVGFST